MTELHEEIAAGQKRLLIRVFASGLPLAMTSADEAISFRLWFLYNGIAAGRVRIVCEFLTSGTSFAMTVTDEAISLSMPFTIVGSPRNASRPDLHQDLCSVPRKDVSRRDNLFVDPVQQFWDCRGTHQD